MPQARRGLARALAADRPYETGRDLRDFLEQHGPTLERQTRDIADQVGSGLRVPMVKALAEAARNAVSHLRRARYDLLSSLSTEIRKGSARQLESYLCGLLELSTAANQAQDRARVAVREGFYLWQTDDDAYHAQRRLMDPTLAARSGAVDGSDRPWFTLYDAAIRQCVSMERQLAEEAASLHDVLGAASTIAVIRDARSQDVLNVIAVAGSVILGLPALLLTLYGMQGEGLPLGVGHARGDRTARWLARTGRITATRGEDAALLRRRSGRTGRGWSDVHGGSGPGVVVSPWSR